tara:strand:+ start:763 stop:1107 length:345 start_codon:yes stop_codon:yes gene_type:complete
MFDLAKCYLARLKWSEWYQRPFYSTTLTLTFEDESLNERLVTDNPEHQQVDDTPNTRLYFGDGEEDFQNADEYVYIIADQNHKGSRILPISLYEKATLKATKEASKATKASAQA